MAEKMSVSLRKVLHKTKQNYFSSLVITTSTKSGKIIIETRMSSGKQSAKMIHKKKKKKREEEIRVVPALTRCESMENLSITINTSEPQLLPQHKVVGCKSRKTYEIYQQESLQ